jgi:cytochrome c
MKKEITYLVLLALLVGGCRRAAEDNARQLTGGDPRKGKTAIQLQGCGSCHTIPGIPGAYATVGPPLNQIASRTYIAGVLKNTPENMVQWLKNPPGVDHKTAMPNLKLSDEDVTNIAAYLYTLK